MRDAFLDDARQMFDVGQFAFDAHGTVRADRIEFRAQRVEFRTRVPVVQREVVARRVQRARNDRADAARGAGDQCDRSRRDRTW